MTRSRLARWRLRDHLIPCERQRAVLPEQLVCVVDQMHGCPSKAPFQYNLTDSWRFDQSSEADAVRERLNRLTARTGPEPITTAKPPVPGRSQGDFGTKATR